MTIVTTEVLRQSLETTRPQDAQISTTLNTQADASATYSLWRDDEDYSIDFRLPADQIVRTILALGDPYPGARATVCGQQMIFVDADTQPDLNFANRQPGKIWRPTSSGPSVVCGTGIIRLTDIRAVDGSTLNPARLRARFRADPPAR